MSIRLSVNELNRLRKKSTPKRQRPARLVQREAAFQKSVCHLLDWLGLAGLYSVTDASRVWSKDGGVRKSKVDADWPDISGTLPGGMGRSFYIENKTMDGVVSAGQMKKHDELRAAGAVVIVPFGRLEDVAAGLKAAGYRHQIIDKLLAGEWALPKPAKRKRIAK